MEGANFSSPKFEGEKSTSFPFPYTLIIPYYFIFVNK